MGDIQQFDVAVRNVLTAPDRLVEFGQNVLVDGQLTVTGAAVLNGSVSGSGVTPGVASAPSQPGVDVNCPAGSFTTIFTGSLATAALAKGRVVVQADLRVSPGATPPSAIAVKAIDSLGNTITLNQEPGAASTQQGWSARFIFPAGAISAQTLAPVVSLNPTGQAVTVKSFSVFTVEVFPSQ